MAEFIERRRFKRYSIYCPLEYKRIGAQQREYSITLNISEGGALFSLHGKPEEGEGIVIRIILRGEEFFLKGKVVHMQRVADTDTYYIGVEFLDRSTEFAMKFYEELECIMFYQRRYSEEMGRHTSLAEASVKWFRSTHSWM